MANDLPGLGASFDKTAPLFKAATKRQLISQGNYSEYQADEIVDLTVKGVSDALGCIERTADLGSSFMVNMQVLLLATQLLPMVVRQTHKALHTVIGNELGVVVKEMGIKP